MEDHTRALDVVCQHFHDEYYHQELANLRKQKARAHSEAYRLRRKVTQLEEHLKIERRLARSLQVHLYRASGKLRVISNMLAELFH